MKSSKRQSVASSRLLLFPFIMIVFAAVVRFAALHERTIHIDEGMGMRASQEALQGTWKFYPANGHGPTLFYAGAAVRALFGDSLPAARSLTAIAGIAMIAFLFFVLRKDLGFFGSMILVTALGFSSGMTFYNVYFIHESLFLLFTTCAYLSARSWFVHGRAAAVGGFFTSLALMYATKETAILTVAAWVAAAAITWFFFRRTTKKKSALFPSVGVILTALCLAVFTHLILFSSFFRNPQGIIDSITAPLHWAERAQVMHARPFMYFLSLLSIHEFALVLSAAILLIIITKKKKWTAELSFIALWFLFITAFYSIISYKTPWCTPNIILPLALFVSFASAKAWFSLSKNGRGILLIVFSFLLLLGAGRMVEDVFLHPDRELSRDYAYLQSNEGLRTMISMLRDFSLIDGRGEFMPMQVLGQSDELIYILTDRYDRSFQPFTAGLPVYVNYLNDADATLQLLRESSPEPYIRLIFTYIQHVNQIDVFVMQSLWDEYRQSAAFVAPSGMDGEAYDYR